jgi:hypothetical protein
METNGDKKIDMSVLLENRRKAMENLAKQPPVSYEEAKRQIQRLKSGKTHHEKMKEGMTFKERAKLAMEALAKQGPITLEEAKAQALWIRGDFPNKEEALKFVRSLTQEEYLNYINGSRPNPTNKGKNET